MTTEFALPPLGDAESPQRFEAEFVAFYHANSARIRNFIRSQVADYNVVEDLVQDTFLITSQAWPRIRGYKQPIGWVYVTARNVVNRYWSSRSPYPIEDIDSIDDTVAERFVPPPDSNAATEALLALLRRLPRRLAQVFYLAHENWSDDEIARILDLAQNTVRTYRHKARRTLQKIVKQDQRKDGQPW